MVQISIIGAGSANFSTKFVVDLCLTKNLWGSRIVLMDIDTERLGRIYKFATKCRKATGADLQFSKTRDRTEALKDADFVISAVKVGGYGPLEAEREIAQRYGFYRGIGDQVSDYYGEVGAYHQLKFISDLASEMGQVCPGSWLVVAANPVFEGVTLVSRKTKIKVVGVCHGHYGYQDIVKVLRLDLGRVDVQMAGFNHCIWLTKLFYNGRDAYPLLDEWIEKKARLYWESKDYLKGMPWDVEQLSPAAVEMYRLYGVFPIGDTVRSASPWWYHTSLRAKQKWFGPTGGFDSEIGWRIYLKLLKASLLKARKASEGSFSSLVKIFPRVLSMEQHIPFVNAVANDEKTLLYLNVPNKGAISGVPDDVAVEIPVVASRAGLQGTRVGELPRRLMLHVMIPRMLRMEQLLHAFLEGDKKSLLLMVLADHRARSFKRSEALLKKLLTQPWNSDAREHYKC